MPRYQGFRIKGQCAGHYHEVSVVKEYSNAQGIFKKNDSSWNVELGKNKHWTRNGCIYAGKKTMDHFLAVSEEEE